MQASDSTFGGTDENVFPNLVKQSVISHSESALPRPYTETHGSFLAGCRANKFPDILSYYKLGHIFLLSFKDCWHNLTQTYLGINLAEISTAYT